MLHVRICKCFVVYLITQILSFNINFVILPPKVPATLMNVFEEMSLKDTRKVNLFYLLFWTSLYQFLTVMLFFWLDILPKFGFSNNIHDFGSK